MRPDPGKLAREQARQAKELLAAEQARAAQAAPAKVPAEAAGAFAGGLREAAGVNAMEAIAASWRVDMGKASPSASSEVQM